MKLVLLSAHCLDKHESGENQDEDLRTPHPNGVPIIFPLLFLTRLQIAILLSENIGGCFSTTK